MVVVNRCQFKPLNKCFTCAINSDTNRGRGYLAPRTKLEKGNDQMTKAQTKQMKFAAGHLAANNPDAFLRSVSAMIRAARTQKQINAIENAAHELQIGGAV